MTNPFTPDEYERRRGAAQAELRRMGHGALWVGTEANFRYLTGIDTPSFATRSRPICLILPAEGDPFIVVAASHVAHMLESSSLSEVYGYDGFEPDAVRLLAELILEHELDRQPIACELGGELRLPVTYSAFLDLQAELPEVEWRDGAPQLWALRSVKSSTEVSVIGEACRITGVAFDAMMSTARPGASQRDLFATFSQAVAEAGGDRVGYFSIHHGTGQDQRSNASPASSQLQAGDLLWVDAGVVFQGYWSDFTRMALIGASDTQRAALYRFVHQASGELLALVRPGLRASDLMRACEQIFEHGGQRIGNATRIGHGVGMDITEPPSLVSGDDTELTPGMTLAIEPGIRSAAGYFVVEENFVVTADGATLLSPRAPAALPVLL